MAFPWYARLYLDGFAETPGVAVERSDMESGPAKQRKVRSRVLVQRPVKYALDSLVDYQNFMNWFKTSINNGADWFDWTDPVDGVIKQARIVDGNIQATPLNKTFRFWDVVFVIETWR